MASPHAACATPRTACVARPLVLRAPRPPAVSGSGANGAGARAEQGEAPGKPRTAVPANPDRELRGRGALGLPTRRARRAVRYVHRAPARGAHAPGARRSEGEARAKRRNGNSRGRTERPTGAQNTDRELRGRSALGFPTRRARRVARRVRRAPARDAPPPAGVRADQGSAARGATEREKKRGEESTTRATSVLDCGGENHP